MTASVIRKRLAVTCSEQQRIAMRYPDIVSKYEDRKSADHIRLLAGHPNVMRTCPMTMQHFGRLAWIAARMLHFPWDPRQGTWSHTATSARARSLKSETSGCAPKLVIRR